MAGGVEGVSSFWHFWVSDHEKNYSCTQKVLGLGCKETAILPHIKIVPKISTKERIEALLEMAFNKWYTSFFSSTMSLSHEVQGTCVCVGVGGGTGGRGVFSEPVMTVTAFATAKPWIHTCHWRDPWCLIRTVTKAAPRPIRPYLWDINSQLSCMGHVTHSVIE